MVARLTELTLEDARDLGRRFGLEVASVTSLDAGSVNSNFRLVARDGSLWFARVYEEQPMSGAELELRLLSELADLGLPVATPIKRADGNRLAAHGPKPFSIYPWIEGEILCQARLTAADCEKLGEAVGTLHALSPRLSRLPGGRFQLADLALRLDEIERTAGEKYEKDLSAIRQALARFTAQRDPGLPQGVIHGDLFKDNVLWRDGQIAALLDFESASSGTFAYDLMVCVSAWCFSDQFELDLVSALFAGYQRARPLSADELDNLVVEGALGCLRFATTRIKDFDMRAPAGKPPIRDFRRFCRRLEALERGDLSPVLAKFR